MNNAVELTKKICDICFDIILRCGPFMKETIYQDLLIHELNQIGVSTTRELVFNYRFNDSYGNPVTICNNQFLRTDVELPTNEAILELKSTTAATKEEQLWQLRNYLENREDRTWGVVINFIHKFGARTSPKVQCDLLYKSDEFHKTSNDTNPIYIRKYQTWRTESGSYPAKEDIMLNTNIDCASIPVCQKNETP